MEKYLFKILLGGCVGHKRSEIMAKFTSGKSNSATRGMIGVDFAIHCIDVPESDESAILQIWNFGEEERFRTLIPGFCQGAAGALLFYEAQNLESLKQLEDWISLLRRYTENIPIVLCGAICQNFGDLHIKMSNNEEYQDIVHEFIHKQKIDESFDVDMENGCNIDETFEALTKLMIQKWPHLVLGQTSGIASFLSNRPE